MSDTALNHRKRGEATPYRPLESISISEAAETLHVSRDTIYMLIRKGYLRAGRYRGERDVGIRVAELERYMREREEAGI